MQQPKVAFLSINTGSYDTFFKAVFAHNQQNFLPDCQVQYFVFTDSEDLATTYANTENVTLIPQEHLAWPGATLHRFKMFNRPEVRELLSEYDYVFFANANWYAKNPILGKNFLQPATGDASKDLYLVYHYGQNAVPEAAKSYERNPQSLAYIPENATTTYVAGGFFGGTSAAFMHMIATLERNIDFDLAKGIIALWHDESHLNHYLYTTGYQAHIMPPIFMVPQEYHPISSYIGERPEWLGVCLNKNLLVQDLNALRNKQVGFSLEQIQQLLEHEKDLDAIWREQRAEFEPYWQQNLGFVGLIYNQVEQ
ncbi:hypothetical protein [Psittacicella hinzii]|uniref:Uncharacterized protein n=1 Tax=Psittacicella hinzii TaxID=2028575 RepID=A0A3A1YUS9_9GAMM|nr:hypothetical protein [Psittacicella hinzii]RIY40600.1 hypothetical protein CKF58_00325 [Psittacicella hinzii]